MAAIEMRVLKTVLDLANGDLGCGLKGLAAECRRSLPWVHVASHTDQWLPWGWQQAQVHRVWMQGQQV